MASEHEVRGQSQLSGGHCCGPGVVGLDAPTGEDTVTASLEGVGQQELQLTDLQVRQGNVQSQPRWRASANRNSNLRTYRWDGGDGVVVTYPAYLGFGEKFEVTNHCELRQKGLREVQRSF